ncbi:MULTISPECIES: hypothetical protein [Kitasatospora]|uniref:Uncharacterized protein n=1 Tax=Kitasatospora setae (strain ATCC 33774 / DSM 43861 / JCM 3304 / KCC A-0304 / NBRC 14216 / KM-6054) TaxID=452652 RepID=E4N8W9_KITSK|nr:MULTISPECIES: hypothetical protein [Kitasatospora]BAJ27650.1 hypothetical protein KSE_18250 [Kitasatospora setae KM-6054]
MDRPDDHRPETERTPPRGMQQDGDALPTIEAPEPPRWLPAHRSCVRDEEPPGE